MTCASLSFYFQESALFLLGNSGDMVFFFFDHLAFLSRIGFFNKELAGEQDTSLSNINIPNAVV